VLTGSQIVALRETTEQYTELVPGYVIKKTARRSLQNSGRTPQTQHPTATLLPSQSGPQAKLIAHPWSRGSPAEL